ALLRRFGSKERLLRAFTRREVLRTEAVFCAAPARARRPLAELEATLRDLGRRLGEADALAAYLAFLHTEMRDPEGRALLAGAWRTCVEAFRRWIAAAQAAGELDVAPGLEVALAERARVALDGALMGWTLVRRGRLEDWLVAQVLAVLEPHVPAGTSPWTPERCEPTPAVDPWRPPAGGEEGGRT
ncbi:MAG: hypothetical protein D6701_13550, partial [Gemmatimonadetes bacterium]